MINLLESHGFQITGIDASEQMIALARHHHTNPEFIVADICQWDTAQKFDLIVAWDSIFHLPLDMQRPVLSKLCGMLHTNGILIYTFGDEIGEHESDWHDDKFYYSAIGITGNLEVMMQNDCECRHLELDQYPPKHVYMIAQKITG